MTKKLLSLILAAVLLVSACIPVCALDEEPAVTCEREVYPVCETVTVSWQAVSGAHTYDLHLFSGRIMVRMLAGLTGLSAALSDLSAGNYTAEVYAYTDTGTELCGDVSFSVGDTAPLAGCKSLQISDGEYLIRSAVDGAVLAGDAQGALITEEYAQGANTAMRLVGKRNYRHEISTRDYNRATASGTEKGAGFIFAEGSADNLNEFFIIVQPDGSFIIELAEKQGYCLTAVGGAVTLEPFNGSRSQKFSFCDAQGAAQPVSLRAPGSIEVYTLPAKTEYIAGESFVFAGLVLTHTYNTGVKERVKTGFTVDCDTSSAGKKTATVSCGALKTKFEVNVIPVQVVSIKMETLPDKLTYKEGEAFLPQGTSIRATYNNGTQLVHTRGLEFYGYTKTPGVKTITVSYEGAQTSFEVSVAPGEVSQLVMIHEPNKTQYYVGEELDLTGLSVAAKYTTGHTQVLSEYIIEGSADSAGYKTIVVSFAGKQTSFGINVIEREVEKIRILTLPQKQIYLEGDSFDPTGITVEAVFSDGTHKQVKGFEMYGYSRSATGLQTIHVNYKDAEATFTVYINPTRATRISVTAKPSKTQYFWGEELNTKGMTVHAWFNNGTDRDVTGYVIQTLEDRENKKMGVVVTYEGQVDFFEVDYLEPVITVTALEITSPAHTLVYFIGDPVDFSGLEVTAHYSDGSSAVTDEYVLSGGSTAAHGSIPVTVSLGGIETEFNIEVGELGDLDNNGTVNAMDARSALRIATKLDAPTKYQLLVGDVDGIDGVSATDARIILRAATGLETL